MNTVASLITSFSIALLIIPVIIRFALKKQLLDEPGRRKIHKKGTPSLGGIAIFIGFTLSSLIWLDVSYWREVRFVLLPFIIIFFTGLRDDLVPLKPTHKLFGQIVAAGFLVFFFDLRLHSFYTIWSTEWPLWLSYLVSILTLVVITNSFNLIDGLDGLAGSISTISLVSVGYWFHVTGDVIFSTFCFSMVGAILAFLCFNWEPSKIFMGDTGAMVIGLFLGIVVIRFINSNYILYSEDEYKFGAEIGSAASFIMIPLLDTLRIIILRIYKGQSPFRPDKSHIHHAIMRLGMNHSKTTGILAMAQALYIVIAILCMRLGDKIYLPLILTFSIILSLLLDRLIIKKLKKQGNY